MSTMWRSWEQMRDTYGRMDFPVGWVFNEPTYVRTSSGIELLLIVHPTQGYRVLRERRLQCQ